jgi:antitoxin PrlF
VLARFLTFLANDIEQFPESLQVLNEDTVKPLQPLVADVEIDLNVPLSAEDE